MPQYVGIDFGTTNSALALADEDGLTCLAMFPQGDSATSTFRSIIYFDPDRRDGRGKLQPTVGPEAISAYLEEHGHGRLIQSLKSYLATPLFSATSVFGRNYTLEELAALIVSGLAEWTSDQKDDLAPIPVVGRPVKFAKAETQDDDDFAINRLRGAFKKGGFDEITFEYEPVAAAYFYESKLSHDEVVLIGDFGGGTSDFCLMRVGPEVRRRGRTPADMLGTEGVALAGDAFDARIVDHLVSPALGLGSEYKSWLEGRILPVPAWIYGRLRRWHHLSFLKSKENMTLFEDLRKQSLVPEKIQGLIDLVENDMGYELYRAVESTKVALSKSLEAPFDFSAHPVELHGIVRRADFDGWIAPELEQVHGCIERLLGKSGVAPTDVDRVFLTGGSSFVPAVRRIFEQRFGKEKVRGGNELTSVALGLALRAADLARQ